jgi:anti-sigma regulatory factor (Ser/Thr protein kinase)
VNTNDGTTSLHVKADLHNLAVIREFVGEQLAMLGIAEDTIHSIILAVDELCANIMLHGYQEQSGTIDIAIAVAGSSVSIQLLDRAPLFDPATAPEPNTSLPPEDRALGGMGIFLARQIMDEMIHEPREGGGNRLTLIKQVF